jgi:hypothetical protein
MAATSWRQFHSRRFLSINSTKQLLDSAVAEQNDRRALNIVQKLACHLHAADDRISELEAEAATYQQRAERAEHWLHMVYTEIEDRFLL